MREGMPKVQEHSRSIFTFIAGNNPDFDGYCVGQHTINGLSLRLNQGLGIVLDQVRAVPGLRARRA